MDAKTFTRKLKDIKAEVLALKQAHEYGLGRADFPWAMEEAYYDEGDTIVITVEFADTVENMPFMQFYMQGGQFWAVSLPSGTWANHKYTIRKQMGANSQSRIYVVATMPIKDFTIEVENV